MAEQDAAISQQLDALEASLQGYHSRADRLQLIPATAKRAEGVNFEVRLDRAASTPGEMINVDLKVRRRVEWARSWWGGAGQHEWLGTEAGGGGQSALPVEGFC